MAPRWTSTDDEQLTRWYREYVPLAEIGRRIDRSAGSVHARRIALGLPTRRRRWPWPQSLDADLAAVARGGVPAAETARRLGLPVDAVCRHRRSLGLASATRRRWTVAEDDELRELLDDPDRQLEFAQRRGRTPLAVQERARALRVDRRSSRPWTVDEDAVLRDAYSSRLTCAAISARLLPDRSPRAVAARARRLGITSYGRRWLPADDAALRALAARGATATQIAHKLTRTTGAVRRRSDRLGVELARPMSRPRAPWTEEEDALLKTWCTLEPGRLAVMLGRSDRAVIARLRVLQLQPDGSPHYRPPTTGRLAPAQRRVLASHAKAISPASLKQLAHKLDRDLVEVARLVAQYRARVA